jgi:hypothetical protein
VKSDLARADGVQLYNLLADPDEGDAFVLQDVFFKENPSHMTVRVARQFEPRTCLRGHDRR